MPGADNAPVFARASLLKRLLLSASIVLAVFVLATGLALDSAFRESAYTAAEDRLKAAIYMMLGATEVEPGNRIGLPQVLPDPRLATPESGFYAEVVDINQVRVWRSRSAVGMQLEYPNAGEIGAISFKTVSTEEADFLVLSYAIAWEFNDGEVIPYEYRAAEDQQGFERQVAGYRRELWSWLGALAIGLLIVQALVLRWGLAPLRRVVEEIRSIERGNSLQLSGDYPAEMQPLTKNLNRLLGSSQSHLQRHRNALADLAHSLKTPLAVLRGVWKSGQNDAANLTLVQEQLDRMDKSINYQLQRAAASGRTALTAPVALKRLVDRLLVSLAKVYAEKNIRFAVNIPPAHELHCDESDLIEILGNLLDNACKWCERKIEINTYTDRNGLSLEVLDDGPGIPDEQRQAVLDRGVRADPETEGQGIGLAVVRELVEEVYSGSLELLDNEPNGARIRIRIPPV